MRSIFEHTNTSDLVALARACGFARIEREIVEAFQLHKAAHKSGASASGPTGELERRWYASLPANPDYSVYDDPFYLADIWLCWTLYSRRGLLELRKPTSMIERSVVDFIGHADAVLDLGCGFGYTTAALAEIFPDAHVMGTNIPTSFQYAAAQALGRVRRFELVERCTERVDVALASEYFEHFPAPIEHAFDVLSVARPRHLIVANGFNGRSIGHFETYTHQGKLYPAAVMSKMFSEALRHFGYRAQRTRIWNNRPAVWSR